MKKSILTAAFATAFLVAGGTAHGGEYVFDSSAGNIDEWYDGSDSYANLIDVPSAASGITVGAGDGIVAIYNADENLPYGARQENYGESLTVTGGTLMIGDNNSFGAGSALELTVSDFNVSGGEMTLKNMGKLITTGESQVGTGGLMTVGGGLELGGVLTNAGLIDFTGMWDDSHLDLSGGIDNSATTATFEPNKVTVLTDYETGLKVDDAVISTVVAGAGSNAGHILVTGAIGDANRDLSSLGAGSVLTFDTLQADGDGFDLGGGGVNLIAAGTHEADYTAGTIYAGFTGNAAFVLSGELNADMLIVNNGDNGAPTTVTLDEDALDTSKSVLGAIQVGSDMFDGVDSMLIVADTANFANTAITNFGTLDANGQLLTLGTYAAGGIIDNSGSAADIGTLASGVQTAYDNTSLANIVEALAETDGNIHNVILTGDVDGTVTLPTNSVTDGAITLANWQTKGGSFALGGNVDLYIVAAPAAGGNGNKIGDVTAATTYVKVRTDITGALNSALDIDADTRIASTGSIVSGSGNNITFSGDHTLTNEGKIYLTGSVPAGAAQSIDFAGTNGNMVNSGTIEIGQNNLILGGGVNNWINNFGEDLAGNDVDGTIIIDGRNAAALTALGDNGAALLTNDPANTDANIGTIVINRDLEGDVLFSSAGMGTVNLKDQQTGAEAVNVGDAALNIDGNANAMGGSVDGGVITFNGKNGVYSADVTGSKGVVIKGSGNTFDENSMLTAVLGDIVIDVDDTKFLGGITTMGADAETILKSGREAAFAGSLDTVFVVEQGAVFRLAGDVEVVDALVAGAGSVIEFGSMDTPGGTTLTQLTGTGTIDLAYDPNSAEGGAKLMISNDADLVNGATYTVFDADALGGIILNGNLATTDADVDAYLASQSYNSITGTGAFERNNNEVQYTGSVINEDSTAEEIRNQWNSALKQTGLYDYRDMLDQNTIDMMYKYSNITEAEMAALSPEEQYLAKLMDGVGGGIRWHDLRTKGQREAVATAQYLTGMDLAGSLEAVTDTVRAFGRNIVQRGHNPGLATGCGHDECGNPEMYCGAGRPNRIWAGYTGLWGDQKDREWDAGYKYDSNGFNIGYDLFTRGGVNFGAAFGYSKGDYENRTALDSDSKIDNYSFGLYGGYTHASGVFASLMGTFTRSDYKMNSRYSTLIENGFTGWDHADFKGNTWSVGGEIGYDYMPVRNLTLTPTLGLYHYSVKTKRFDTTARYDMKYSRTQTEMPLELAVKYDMHTGDDSMLSLTANGGYAYNFSNKGVKVHQFGYTGGNIAGESRYVKPGRSGWNVGGGVQFKYRSFDIAANYEYYGRKEYTSHNVTANVGVGF